MQNTTELPFDGFKHFVQLPLAQSDPASFERIKNLFIDIPQPPLDPFRIIILKLTGKSFVQKAAKDHWQRIVLHKNGMQAKLGRRVSILVAATDYFDVTNVPKSTGDSALLTRDNTAPHFTIDANEEWISRVYAPSYHIEKMKEELLRAKRYKHALSAVLLDIDNFSKVNEEHSLKTGDEILSLVVKIIKKTIRAVDIIARYSGDRFLIILPNTNRREAVELAERLRVHIADRSKLVAGVSEGVTATFAVGQCNQDDRSTEFLKMLEHRLDTGKQKTRNSIHICENC